MNNVGSINKKMEFEGYIESWKSNTWQTLENMPIHSQTVIDIAFGNLGFTTSSSGDILSIGGLEMSDEEFQKVVAYIHAREGKVKLSVGGATYPFSQFIKTPSDALFVAQELSKVIQQYDLDGIDLDLEDGHAYPDFSKNIILFIKKLHQLAPSESNLSLTVPGGAWFDPWQKIIPEVKNDVSYLTFMEYNIWVDPSRTFVEQVKWDIAYYQKLWGVQPEQMRLGLMPGYDDMGHSLTVKDAQELSLFAKNAKLNGVMIWSLNRDYEGLAGNPSDAYLNAIMDSIQVHSIGKQVNPTKKCIDKKAKGLFDIMPK